MEQISNQQRDKFIMDSLNQGMSLSDVQKALASDYGLRMTYLELRMLALQLQVDWHKQDKKKPEPPAPPAETQDMPAADETSSAGEQDAVPAEEDDYADDEAPMGGQGPDLSRTQVTVSKLVRPGTSLSGDVVFDSGAKGEWYIDQLGRLGLDLAEGSSQPNQNDIMLFQLALRKQLQGY
jgi:hypothetical protein